MLPFVTDEFDRVGAMPELVLPGEFGVLVIIVGEDNSRLLLAGAGAERLVRSRSVPAAGHGGYGAGG